MQIDGTAIGLPLLVDAVMIFPGESAPLLEKVITIGIQRAIHVLALSDNPYPISVDSAF